MMTEQPHSLDPARLSSHEGPLRLVLSAWLEPVAGLDRFQPAGFPEIGHVTYGAPRSGNTIERVCIVDSPASMANHLESVCQRSRWDPELVEDLQGMPYLRCVTTRPDGATPEPPFDPSDLQAVVTSLTEGHRIASTYFFGERKNGRWNRVGAQRLVRNGSGLTPADESFGDELAKECGIALDGSNKAHPPPEAWWKVFSTIFKHDPNSLVHGVLFPKWQVRIPRMLTAHLEAFGAGRVDSSGVKFDRLGKTTSGQPIFARDDATAREIRATFVLDLALLRSFGFGKHGDEDQNGLAERQREYLVALALWKIGRLVSGPFRYRSGCDLECTKVVVGTEQEGADLRDDLANIRPDTRGAGFEDGGVTDIYWPRDALYRAERDGSSRTERSGAGDDGDDHDSEYEG